MVTSSKLINESIDEISRLPGIGKKTALRLILHILKKPTENTHKLCEAIVNMRDNIKHCKTCGNISDDDVCNICKNNNKDTSIICAVEDFTDILTIESTQQYQGLYHVIGGVLDPVNGIGAEDLSLSQLYNRVANNSDVSEILCALSSSMEGNSTIRYINNMFEKLPVKVTILSQGIAVGEEIKYTDTITLGRSIKERKLV